MGCSSLRTDSIKWDDLDALRIWPHKLIVKGMLDAHDAAEAVNHGADGVDVSNHGGRNLTGSSRRWKCCRKSWTRSASARQYS